MSRDMEKKGRLLRNIYCLKSIFRPLFSSHYTIRNNHLRQPPQRFSRRYDRHLHHNTSRRNRSGQPSPSSSSCSFEWKWQLKDIYIIGHKGEYKLVLPYDKCDCKSDGEGNTKSGHNADNDSSNQGSLAEWALIWGKRTLWQFCNLLLKVNPSVNILNVFSILPDLFHPHHHVQSFHHLALC